MIVREKLTNIFTTLETQHPFQDVFNFVSPELLDIYYVNMYGNRNLTGLAENVAIEDLARLINDQFMSKWNNIILNYLDSENILNNYKVVISEVNADTTNNTSNHTTTTKVSAFNDNDFINKDEDIIIDVTDSSNNRKKDVVKSVIKDTDFYSKVINYLTGFNIYNIMMQDINSIATLNILN